MASLMAPWPLRKRKASQAAELPDVKRTRYEQDDKNGSASDDSGSNYSPDDIDVRSDDEEEPGPRQLSSVDTPPTSASPSLPDKDRRQNLYFCSYDSCGKSFNRPCRLEEHLRSHTNERPFACEEHGCNKTFIRKVHLTRHLVSAHSDVRKFVCDWPGCDKKFANGTRLRRHKESHDQKEQFRCKEYPPCNESFRKHATLQKHIMLVHLGQKPFPCTEIDQTTGEPCARGFETQAKLDAHIARIHGGNRYVCNLCGSDPEVMPDCSSDAVSEQSGVVGFPTYAALQAHIHEVHPPTCPHCSTKCQSQKQLRAHIDITHSKATLDERRTFPCTYPGCGRSFTRNGNLKVHIQTVHNKVRGFICGEADLSSFKDPAIAQWDGTGACGRGLATKQGLEDHIKTQHLGIPGPKNHGPQLDVNGNRMTRRRKKKAEASALRKLTGVEHDDETGRGVRCLLDSCEQTFTHDVELEAHCQRAHGLALYEITERIKERNAREGGAFWVGGVEGLEWGELDDPRANYELDMQMGIEPGLGGLDIREGNMFADYEQSMEHDAGSNELELTMKDAVLNYLYADET